MHIETFIVTAPEGVQHRISDRLSQLTLVQRKLWEVHALVRHSTGSALRSRRLAQDADGSLAC